MKPDAVFITLSERQALVLFAVAFVFLSVICPAVGCFIHDRGIAQGKELGAREQAAKLAGERRAKNRAKRKRRKERRRAQRQPNARPCVGARNRDP